MILLIEYHNYTHISIEFLLNFHCLRLVLLCGWLCCQLLCIVFTNTWPFCGGGKRHAVSGVCRFNDQNCFKISFCFTSPYSFIFESTLANALFSGSFDSRFILSIYLDTSFFDTPPPLSFLRFSKADNFSR